MPQFVCVLLYTPESALSSRAIVFLVDKVNLLQFNNFHFIGIGGIGVSALARMMLGRGAAVSGSDGSSSAITAELEKLGAKVFVGHDANQVSPATQVVIYSPAIVVDNPELVAARGRGLPAYSYPEALGLLSVGQEVVAIAGAHGKTTTTAMVAHVLLAAKLAPTVVVGSLMTGPAGELTNFIPGAGKIFVVEACEYKRSFLNLSPNFLIITNIDDDHLDYYKDLADIQSAFIELVCKLPSDGVLITDTASELLQPILVSTKVKVINYRDFISQVPILLTPGQHNVFNAAAALAVVQELGVDMAVAAQAIGTFSGAARRLQYRGQTKTGARVYDDYAHHPTEIAATIEAVRELKPRALYIVFQPHLFSRTKLLLNRLAESLQAADHIFVTDIYAARELPDPTINSQMLVAAIGSKACYVSDGEMLVTKLLAQTEAGDIIVLMGAGDIYRLANRLV